MTASSGPVTLIKARRVYLCFRPSVVAVRAIAVADGRVSAVSAEDDGLDGLLTPGSRVIDAGGLTVMPGLSDSHNHFGRTAVDARNVDLDDALSLRDVIGAIRARALTTPPGQWIVSSAGWHESNLAEDRLPTATELDRASAQHPVLVKRGGHVVILNSWGLHEHRRLTGTVDPRSSGLGPAHSGVLWERPRFARVLLEAERHSEAERRAAITQLAEEYGRHGITSVREPGVDSAEYDRYVDLVSRGQLALRMHPLIRIEPSWPVERMLATVEEARERRRSAGRLIGPPGVKVFADGGIETAWRRDSPDGGSEHQLVSEAALRQIVGAATRSGVHVGIHAVGDAALRMVLDSIEASEPDLRANPRLVAIEHAFIADDECLRRIRRAGICVTMQFPLVYQLASAMRRYWDAPSCERSMRMLSAVRAGIIVGAGTDSNVAPFAPMAAVHGSVTRLTRASDTIGPAESIDRPRAFHLYTHGSAAVSGESGVRGTLWPGMAADLTAFDRDPLDCELDELPGLRAAFTLVEGKPLADSAGLFADAPTRGQEE